MKKEAKKQEEKKYPESVWVETTVSRIEMLNQEINGKLKTVFYCPSYYAPKEGRMSIIWGRVHIQEGDKIQMKGRFYDGVFVATKLTILMKHRQNGDENGDRGI